jgi:hypothetical protein
MADAIPPPPDLKTLLRQSASDYRAMTSSASAEELELARKEREIIETLEKEEQERMSSSSASAHDRSHDGAEYEITVVTGCLVHLPQRRCTRCQSCCVYQEDCSIRYPLPVWVHHLQALQGLSTPIRRRFSSTLTLQSPSHFTTARRRPSGSSDHSSIPVLWTDFRAFRLLDGHWSPVINRLTIWPRCSHRGGQVATLQKRAKNPSPLLLKLLII